MEEGKNIEMDAAVSFGEVLKELRNRKKLSRPKLAQQLHMHPSSIEKWERGDVLPDRARIEELIRALRLSKTEKLLLLEAHAGHRILPSLHNVPAAQNPYFTGREDILAQLHDHLAPGSQIALTQAISGLGGIGKTQVALHYVYHFQQAYSHILWVTADSSASLITGFVELARDLELPEKTEKDQGKIVQAVQRWLREYLDWLLILDNVEDLSLVPSYIPAKHLGSVLMTTRRQVTEPVAQALVLDVLSEDEGVLLLLKRAKRLTLDASLDEASASEVAVARAITQQLGGLPLALDQAGAYIAETGCRLSGYLALFKREQQALLQRRGTVLSDHPQSVATTFALAFEQVYQKNPAARDLLNVCAFLVPDAIPLEVFTEGASYLGTTLETLPVNALQFDQALEVLKAYSLVQRDGENCTLSLHRLVQAVLQNTLEEAEKHMWAERTLLAINAAFPHTEHGNWSKCEHLLPQALAAAQLIEKYHIINEEAGRLVYETAIYLRDRAHYAEAEPFFQRALTIFEQQLGTEHPITARSLNGLASLYWSQGKYREAELIFQRALTTLEQRLGTEHPITATCLNNLALLYYRWGRYHEAEHLFQRALAIREQQLGTEHPSTAGSFINFALLYDSWGKYRKAEVLYKRALSIYQKVYGFDHPDTAMSLISLAELYRQQGKYGEVEPLLVSARLTFEKVYGPDDHPNTALCLHLLASLYLAQGKYQEAEPLFQRALAIRERQLGVEHPSTATSLNSLADLYLAQGKYQEAEPLLQRTLKIREKQLGPEHPDVASSLNSLADLYLAQGKYQEAEPLLQRALTTFEQKLGLEHPYIATSLNSLAELNRVWGKYAEASLLYQRAYSIQEQALGQNHPALADTLHSLAVLSESQGDLQEAFHLYQQSLAIREQALGGHHPKTIETRSHLIVLLHTMGQHEEAAQLESTQVEQKASEEDQKSLPGE